MLKKLILITMKFFHLHNFASAANVEEKKGFKIIFLIYLLLKTLNSTVILSHGSAGVWKHTYMWKDFKS